MPDIFAETNDGFQTSGLLSSWDSAHDAVGQSSPSTTSTTYNFAVGTIFASGRGAYFIRRSFFEFDTSGILVAPSSATFQIFVPSTSYDNSSLILVKSGHDPSDTTEDWFSTWLTGLGGTISGWSNTDSEVVPYSSNLAAGMGAGYVSLTLNSDALSDMASLSSFKVVLMNYSNDYLDSSSSHEGFTGLIFADNGGTSTSKDPKINYVEATSNYGHAVMGVASGNIAKVNGVATANIDKVIGVD